MYSHTLHSSCKTRVVNDIILTFDLVRECPSVFTTFSATTRMKSAKERYIVTNSVLNWLDLKKYDFHKNAAFYNYKGYGQANIAMHRLSSGSACSVDIEGTRSDNVYRLPHAIYTDIACVRLSASYILV